MKNMNLLSFQITRRQALRSLCVTLAAGGIMPLVSSLGQGSFAHAASPNAANAPNVQRALIVYYSRSGNTRAVAEQIRLLTGANMVEIQTVTPYPAEYRATTDQAKKELAEGYKPPLTTKVADMASYDLIYVGSPNWWSTIAPPVMTFLSEYDFSGKTLVPFMTHGGGGMGRMVQDIKALCPKATVLDGFSVRDTASGRAHEGVAAWLTKLGLGG